MFETESSNGSKKAELFEHLLRSLELRFSAQGEAPPFHEWVQGIILDGRPFTFVRHEYLIEPYQDDHPHLVEMKAAQLGLDHQGHAPGRLRLPLRGLQGGPVPVPVQNPT